jgi:sulfate permease, SulP family
MNLATGGRGSARTSRWRGDIFGGTVAALIAVPYGMALSLAIGLRPEAGLYTSIIGGAISGVFTRAPIVVSGLSATVVPAMAMLVKTHGVGAALAAGVLSGLIMTLIGALGLGRFFNFLPKPVISAFTSGLGVIIAVSQIKVVLGVQTKPAGFDLGVVDDLWVAFREVGASDPHTLAITALVFIVLFLLPRLAPKFEQYIPASLIAVIMASLLVYIFHWPLRQVGALPESFPTPSLSVLDFSAFSALLHPAFTLAGLITINQLLTVVVTDRLKEERGEVRFNRELIVQGAANMACPFFGAPPGVAMLARTVASARAGAVSRWSVVAHSVVLVLFLLPLRNVISQIPLAVLAAITVGVGVQLIGVQNFRELKRMSRLDAGLFILTFGLVIFSDLIVGVGVGALVAMLLFVERAANATHLEPVTPDPAKQEPSASFLSPESSQAQMQMYRLSGPLFFASSEKVLNQLTREVTAKTLVLDLAGAGPIDTAATDCLRRIAKRQRDRGGDLQLIGLDQRLFDSFERDGLLEEVGTSRSREFEALGSGPERAMSGKTAVGVIIADT